MSAEVAGAATEAARGESKEAFLRRVRRFVGTRARPPWVGPDPVNRAMIRQWCEVLGDANPVYTDEELAVRSVHRGIVAPPTMLDAWVMRGFIDPADPDGPDQGQAALLDAMAGAGFTAIVATNARQVYRRYLRPGDVVTAHRTIEEISEEKRTALGPGHFFTVRTSYVDAGGEEVGEQRFRMLVYRPNAPSAAPAPAARRPRPSISDDTAFFWAGARRGELLLQRCADCGELRHPPGPMCPRCRSPRWTTLAASGLGEVFSFVVYHHPAVPPFEPPYVVGLIELAEGVRLVSNLIEVEPGDVRIGMPVRVRFVAVDDDLTLPMFVPRG